MERLSLQGDFFDCQLYGGRLYLWTFNGSVQVYNYTAIIREWARRYAGSINRCEQYENGMSLMCFNGNELRRFLVAERDYLTDEFPTGTEILSNELYETNVKGLFRCHIPVFSERMPVERVSEVPLVYINGAQRRGLVCAGGGNGIFWMPNTEEKPILFQISKRQTIKASFCSPGIYAYSTEGDSFLLLKDDRSHIINEGDLYPDFDNRAYGPRMSWSWDNYFYIAEEHKLKVYEFISAYTPMRLKEEINFFYWKGEFVSAGSCWCGTVVELENAICLFEDIQKEGGHCTIMNPVTRWRMYPRSKEFPSHIHIIFDDRMDIVLMKDNVQGWYEYRYRQRRW